MNDKVIRLAACEISATKVWENEIRFFFQVRENLSVIDSSSTYLSFNVTLFQPREHLWFEDIPMPESVRYRKAKNLITIVAVSFQEYIHLITLFASRHYRAGDKIYLKAYRYFAKQSDRSKKRFSGFRQQTLCIRCAVA